MTKNKGRVVGLDVHPDSFAGAVVEGTDPGGARVLSSSTRVELERLEQWGATSHSRRRHTGVGSQRQFVFSGDAAASDWAQSGDPGQSLRGQGGQSLLRQRSSGCGEDRAHLFERAFPYCVATR